MFQLTRPVGGRTSAAPPPFQALLGFNSLAPWGANHGVAFDERAIGEFQLTRPVGGEPMAVEEANPQLSVSTHSPRGGRTPLVLEMLLAQAGFNSLAPWGANRYGGYGSEREHEFQLTRPVGGEPEQKIL